MEDKDLLLSKIPADKGLGNKTAREILEWDEPRYQAAKDILLAEKLIVLGPGKGGSIRLIGATAAIKQEQPKVDLTGFANDEDALLSLLPEDKQVNNRKLQSLAGWDEPRFQTARNNLLENSKAIGCTGGPGGALRRFKDGDQKKEINKTEKEKTTAVDLTAYPTPEDALFSLIPDYVQINNRKLQQLTGWDDNKFQAVRKNLLDQSRITSCTGGPGGATKRFRTGDPKREPVAPAKIVDTNEPQVIKDPVIWAANNEETANAIVEYLRGNGYPSADFYVRTEENEARIKLRRKYPITMNPDVKERLHMKAEEAALWVEENKKSAEKSAEA